MEPLTVSTYQHQRAQQLLAVLNRAIFVLKLDAQGRLDANNLSEEDVEHQQDVLFDFLRQLETAIHFLSREEDDEPSAPHTDYLVLAHRYIQINPTSVTARCRMLTRLRDKLSRREDLQADEFHQLDTLHRLLEERVIQGYKGLYRL